LGHFFAEMDRIDLSSRPNLYEEKFQLGHFFAEMDSAEKGIK